MLRKNIFCAVIFSTFFNCFASEGDERIKTGFTFGALPAVAYDSDSGLKYGALANFYFFGDGSTYPKYLHSMYVEWHRTTRGSGLMQFVYDSDFLIPNIRLTLEASNFTEQAIDFYGFNGYQAWYNPDFYQDFTHDDFRSQMFYRHERQLLRLRSDFQGNIVGNKLRWMAGYEFNKFDVGAVNRERLNKGREDEIPNTPTLFENFVDWGVINENEKNGGNHNMFKFGLVYDTRDNEPNPMRGVWSEIMLVTAPSFNSATKSFTKLAITHRQYFTLVNDVLSLATRLSYQPKLGGTIPFYALPFVYSTNTNIARDGRDGLGGGKTLRGILRNRAVGDDLFFGNVELRWKFIRTVLWNQNLYLALTGGADFGKVTRDYEFDRSNSDAQLWFIENPKKSGLMHLSVGGGLSIALNHNFIVHVNYGRAIDNRDGTSGVYIGLNFLF